MKKILYVMVIIWIIPLTLYCQRPFSELCFHFNGYDVMKADLLGKYYDVFNYGGSFGISAPIYFGRLMANTSIQENIKLDNFADNYFSLTATIEWDIPIKLTRYFQLVFGLGAGNYFMYFPEKLEEDQLESEICLLGKVGLEANVFPFLSISCNYYRKEISTFHKLYIDEVSIGFYLRLKTGKNFREFLK